MDVQSRTIEAKMQNDGSNYVTVFSRYYKMRDALNYCTDYSSYCTAVLILAIPGKVADKKLTLIFARVESCQIEAGVRDTS